MENAVSYGMQASTELSELQSATQEYMRTGDHDAALQCAARADTLDDPRAHAFAAYLRGAVSFRRGDYAEAQHLLTKAADLYARCADADGEARAAGMLASVYTMYGDYPTAFAMFRTALDRFEVVGDLRGQALSHTGLGHVLNGTGDQQAALDSFARALSCAVAAGDATVAAGTRLNISSTMLNLDDVDGAHEELLRARERFVELNDTPRVAMIDVNLGTTHLRRGEIDAAREIVRRIDPGVLDDPETWYGYQQTQAALHRADGRYDDARAVLERMLVHAADRGMRAHEARAHEQLRDVAKDAADFASYVRHNEAFTEITNEIKGGQTARALAILEKQRELDVIARERDRERTVLYSTLPKAVADRVIRGETVNDIFPAASVLFADVAGFTEQSARFGSDEVIGVLATLHRAIDERCLHHGVVKIKTIGDAYLAFAGEGTDAENCARTAALAADMVALHVAWPDGTPLTLRIGMQVGPVSAGVIGTDRLQYDVWGDTVNMASRLEHTGQPGHVHVADERYAVDGFALEERGLVELKGKGETRTYWLRHLGAGH